MKAPWIETGTLVTGGKTLEYTCSGPPPSEAPTLVLLHEGLGCTQLWRDFPASLSKATGFGVFAYSRAGYGQSSPTELPRPLDYMTREAVDVLPEVLTVIDVQSAVLLGHSDGATIAAIHAGRVVDSRVIGIVLLAPHFFTEASGLAEIAKARDAFNAGDLRTRLSKYHRDPDNAFRGWNDSWLNPEFESWNVANALNDIRVPVLAIQGDKDPYGTLAQIDAVKQRVHQATVSTIIITDCRHAPHLEYGPLVIDAVADFCNLFEVDTTVFTDKPSKEFKWQLPSYAYIPGLNARHPEDSFDRLKRTVAPGHDAQALTLCPAFRAGLQFLDAGFYWEAHEVLEPVWMALPANSVERQFVQGLIQLANGCLKLRMGRPKAALRLVDKARQLMPVDDTKIVMSLEVRTVHDWISALETKTNLSV